MLSNLQKLISGSGRMSMQSRHLNRQRLQTSSCVVYKWPRHCSDFASSTSYGSLGLAMGQQTSINNSLLRNHHPVSQLSLNMIKRKLLTIASVFYSKGKIYNTRCASTENSKQSRDMADFINKLSEADDQDISSEEWKQIAAKFDGNPRNSQIWPGLMLEKFADKLKFKQGHSLYRYIIENEIPRTVFIKMKYIELCGMEGFGVNQELILKLYKEIREESTVFHPAVVGSVMNALAHTDQWRECLHLLEECKTVGSVFENSCVYEASMKRSYCSLVSAAVRAQDFQVFSTILSSCDQLDMVPNDQVYEALFSGVHGKEGFVDYFLTCMQNYQWLPSRRNAKQIKEHFEKRAEKEWQVHISRIQNGVCEVSRQRLRENTVTETEFKELREDFMKNCIIGDDIYLKSNPEELKKFKKFIKKTGQVDAVVDGLNLMYHDGRRIDKQLVDLVKILVAEYGYKVIVVTRKLWSKRKGLNPIDQISGISNVFFAEKMSSDDVYSLYAALHSGNHTLLFSKDQMRQHSTLLSDRAKKIFRKWQTSCKVEDIRFLKKGRVSFKFPTKHALAVQKSGLGWHIPYTGNDSKANDAVDEEWFFIKKM